MPLVVLCAGGWSDVHMPVLAAPHCCLACRFWFLCCGMVMWYVGVALISFDRLLPVMYLSAMKHFLVCTILIGLNMIE